MSNDGCFLINPFMNDYSYYIQCLGTGSESEIHKKQEFLCIIQSTYKTVHPTYYIMISK